MRGRKPVPTPILQLRGSRKIGRRNEPRPPTAIPTCPPHLDQRAKAEWKRITKLLAAMKLLTKLDRATLATYCSTWSRLVDAETKLREHGLVVKSPSGYPMQNPYLSVVNRSIEQLGKIATEFGLTPSSRVRLSVPTAPVSDADPFAELEQKSA